MVWQPTPQYYVTYYDVWGILILAIGLLIESFAKIICQPPPLFLSASVMVDPYENQKPLPDEQPICSDGFTESGPKWPVKDGDENASLTSKLSSELALVSDQQVDDIIGALQLLNKKQLDGVLRHMLHYTDKCRNLKNLCDDFMALDFDYPLANKKKKTSFMEAPNDIKMEELELSGREKPINIQGPRRALISQQFVDLWNYTSTSPDNILDERGGNDQGFYGFVLRAHELFFKTPCYYYKFTQYVTGRIANNLSMNNINYWASRGGMSLGSHPSEGYASHDSQSGDEFSGWYDRICAYISAHPNIKDHILDHLVCASMVAIYYAFENKMTAVVLCAGIFTLYYYRTGRNAVSESVFSHLMGRLEKLFSETASAHFDYFGIGGKESSDQKPSQVFKWLDISAKQINADPSFVTQAGDENDSKGFFGRDIVKSIEGFYKELQTLKLTPLLMGVTGVVAVSGFCAVTGRSHDEIADFDVTDYMRQAYDFERIGSVTQIWEAIKAIYNDVRTYFEFKYLSDKKRSYLEFRKLRQELIKWEDKGKELLIHVPESAWATMNVVKQLKWRLEYCQFREYAEKELMANRNFEVVQAIHGQSGRTLRIKTMYNTLCNHYMTILSHKFRTAPFGINIEGGTGLAKSTILMMIQQFILNHHLGIDMGLIKQLTYYYSGDDSAFWDGATSSHLLCVMDDVDKYLQNIEPEGNKGIKALLAIMNNLPFNLNQATLELKGKVFAMYYAIIATSNTITAVDGRSTLDISGIYKHPGATGRRFKLVVQILPTPEYENGQGSIDSKKLAQFQAEHPGEPPNAWRIRCLRTVATNIGYQVTPPQYIPIPNPRLIEECGDLARATLRYGQNLYYYDIVDFLNMLGTELEAHDEVQQRFFEVSETGYDFEKIGIRKTNGAPKSFRDMLGKTEPIEGGNTTEFSLESGLTENPATCFFLWPFVVLGFLIITRMVVWAYGSAIHAWYVLYNTYADVCHFFVLVRRIGGIYRTILYYRDSARLSNWVNRHKAAIALVAGTSAVSAAAFKVYQHISKKEKKELQSGGTVRTVPVPHGTDFLPAYQAPKFARPVGLSCESTSIQAGDMISSCGKNKTHIIKMVFHDPVQKKSSDTHVTIFSYQVDKAPRGFFNKHALEKWRKNHTGSWYVMLHGIIAGSKEPAIFSDEYFLSRLVELPVGDTRDLAIIDLRPPPDADYRIRAFKRNDQYLLTKDNFVDADGKMKDRLLQTKLTFVKLVDDEMRVNTGGLVTKVLDSALIQDSSAGLYEMGTCLQAEMKEVTGPGDCGNPYLLQKVIRPGTDKVVECAFVAIHGAGSTTGDHFNKLLVPVMADDMVLPPPVMIAVPEKPIVVDSDFSTECADIIPCSGSDEFDARRRSFEHYESKTCPYPVPEHKIMHLPNIDKKSNGEIKQHPKSKHIEDQAALLSGSLYRPIGNFTKSTYQWIADTMGAEPTNLNDTSAHLYGTCRSIDVRTPEGTRNYTVALGKMDSNWYISPLYDNLCDQYLSTIGDVIKTNKIPPPKHVAAIKEAKCLKGDIDYDKLSERKLAEYDTASILSDIMSQPSYSKELAGKMFIAADHYIDTIVSKIDITQDLMRYPVEEGIPINGHVNEDGVRLKSLEALDMNTSAGPPMTYMRPGQKGKHDWFEIVKYHPDGRVERAMGDTLAFMVDEARAKIREGYRVVHQVFWKDEPANPLSEGDRKPKRPIFVAPVYFNILMREYLLSLNRTMAAFPFVFQQAVGFDSSSEQWAQTRNYVFGLDSANKVFDGDYRKFDRGLLQEVTDAVRYFIMTLCIKSGNYNEDDLIIANNLLKCATCPVVNFHGTLYNFRSVNTSGNPLTTQINCIANNILIWYVFLEKYNTFSYYEAHKLYKDYVRAMVYGDDNIVGSVPHPKFDQVLTCNDMQDYLKGIIGYTDAAKNSVVKPFSPHDEITLLGRYFRKDGDMVLDKFELKRLWRMLLMYQHRTAIPVQVCLSDIYDSALYELARYDVALFNEVRELLIEGLQKYQLETIGREYTREQIVQAFFSTNKGIEQTYEFYRQRVVEHNSRGKIDDPRYSECCPDGGDFSLHSGDCYYMDALPVNYTETERLCFMKQNLDMVTIPFSYVCGSDRLASGFEACAVFFFILQLIWDLVSTILNRFSLSLTMLYAFRQRPMMMPGSVLVYFISYMWHCTGVAAMLD